MRHKGKPVAHSRRTGYFDGIIFGQQSSGFGVDAVDEVNLARHQSLGTCGGVADIAKFHPIKITAVGLPVVPRFALEG